jgi:prevent-host-death family protein
MLEIDSLEAEKQFDDLLERAERGEEIVVTRNGRPIAKLIWVATTSDSVAHTTANALGNSKQ